MPVESFAKKSFKGNLVTKIYNRKTNDLVSTSINTAVTSHAIARTRTYVLNGLNYWNAVRNNRLPPKNAFTFLETFELHPIGVVHENLAGGLRRSEKVGNFSLGTVYPPLTLDAFSSADKSRLQEECKREVLLKLKDQKANFVQIYAEWNKTSDLVTGAATSIYKSYRNLRRGNFAQAARDLGVTASKRGRRRFNRNYARNQEDAAASGWLELQYGWKPLLQDVYGAAEHAARSMAPVMRSRVAKKKRLTTAETEVSKRTADGRSYALTEDKSGTFDVQYVVHFHTAASLAHSASQSGLLNPAQVAWELLPFSFVIDWFLPIGDTLKALDATVGLVFDSGCVTYFEKQQVVARQIATAGISDVSWSVTRTRVDRFKLTDFPTVSFPRLKPPFSVTRMFSALSLLSTFRK